MLFEMHTICCTLCIQVLKSDLDIRYLMWRYSILWRAVRVMFDAGIAPSRRRMIPLISTPLCSRCVVLHVPHHTPHATRHTSHANCFSTPLQGYNAVCTLNRKCSGSITTDDLDFVVARWFMLMAETMISAGIPQDKMFTHAGECWSFGA